MGFDSAAAGDEPTARDEILGAERDLPLVVAVELIHAVVAVDILGIGAHGRGGAVAIAPETLRRVALRAVEVLIALEDGQALGVEVCSAVVVEVIACRVVEWALWVVLPALEGRAGEAGA